jgi:hypothetical protein
MTSVRQTRNVVTVLFNQVSGKPVILASVQASPDMFQIAVRWVILMNAPTAVTASRKIRKTVTRVQALASLAML